MQLLRRWPRALLPTLTFLSTISLGGRLPASAAERIEFFIGPLEPVIFVEDLATFAEDGLIPERLEFVASRFDETQLEAVRALLNTSFRLDPVAISQFTNGPSGEALLKQAGQVVQTDSFRNGYLSLRASLIAAATSEDCCTVLDLLQQYPLETIQLNLSLTMDIIEENQRIFQLRDEVIAGVRQIAIEQVEAAEVVSLPAFEPHEPGIYQWQRETFEFQNPNRATLSIADLYLPSLDSPAPATTVPVVVISHGLASDRRTFGYLAEHLASHGYGVIALEHAQTSAERFDRFLRGLEGSPPPAELLNLPRDVTAALDVLERRAIDEPRLQSLNLEAVGVLGQSLGGYTALAAGGAKLDRSELEQQCLTSLSDRPSVNLSLLVQCLLLDLPEETPLAVEDDRVKAIVAVNPVTSSLFGEGGLSQLQTPLLMIGGSDDYIAPIVAEQITPFTWLTLEESYLVIMERGTHFSFLGTGGAGPFALPPSFIGPDPLLARPQLKGLSLAFFNRYLLNRAEDSVFLTQAYLNTLEQVPFQFDIIQNFF